MHLTVMTLMLGVTVFIVFVAWIASRLHDSL